MPNTPYLADYWVSDPERDALNFSDFRPALKNILLGAQTPLTVGVYGPWGSGKTSLMRMLKHEIDDEGLKGQRTVWFTAWKYDRYDALWRAFILRVLDALYPREEGDGPWEERERIPAGELSSKQRERVERLERLEEGVYRPVSWQELGRRTIDWWQALKGSGKAGAEIAAAFLPGALAAPDTFMHDSHPAPPLV